MIDVAVAGGGPVGARVAGLLAKKGFSVAILEEHREIGRPIHCAGLVSMKCHEMLGCPRVLAELRAVKVHSPRGHDLEVRADGVRAVAIDRQETDKSMAVAAVNAGAQLKLGFQITGVRESRESIFAKSPGEELQARLLIGADGAGSAVRRSLGIDPPEELLPSFETELLDDVGQMSDVVDVWIGNSVAPGFFAWSIPANGILRVGLAVTPGLPARDFLHAHLERAGLSGKKILATYAGLLPIGGVKRPYADRALLVGDAAGHVKPLSGGGLFPGLVAAGTCAEVAAKALDDDKLDVKSLSNYGGLLEKALGSEIARAHTLRAVFKGMDDRALDSTLKTLSKPAAVAYIAAEGDIDFPSGLAKGLLAKCPGLLGLAPRALKSFL